MQRLAAVREQGERAFQDDEVPVVQVEAEGINLTPSSPFDKATEYSTGIKFADMSGTQKCVFAAKLVVCIATFGFTFPNVQRD